MTSLFWFVHFCIILNRNVYCGPWLYYMGRHYHVMCYTARSFTLYNISIVFQTQTIYRVGKSMAWLPMGRKVLKSLYNMVNGLLCYNLYKLFIPPLDVINKQYLPAWEKNFILHCGDFCKSSVMLMFMYHNICERLLCCRKWCAKIFA